MRLAAYPYGIIFFVAANTEVISTKLMDSYKSNKCHSRDVYDESRCKTICASPYKDTILIVKTINKTQTEIPHQTFY